MSQAQKARTLRGGADGGAHGGPASASLRSTGGALAAPATSTWSDDDASTVAAPAGRGSITGFFASRKREKGNSVASGPASSYMAALPSIAPSPLPDVRKRPSEG